MKRPDLDPSRLRTIDDVLRDLDRIIDWSLDEPSRLGYFVEEAQLNGAKGMA